jgi:itaconate CoA-transferase
MALVVAESLNGIRVVALEQAVAGPLCTRHLADLGAEVIKVERPDGGDFARRYDSVVHGESAYFVWLNHGKRSLALDLQLDPDRLAFDELLASSDVFVHNLGPGAVDRLGYSWSAVHQRWPRLVSCAISGYGATGPYRDHKAFDLLVQGESGLLSVTGSPSEPAKVGISIADISAGMYSLVAILAALRSRDRTGAGESIEISMLHCMAEWMTVPTLYERYGGGAPSRSGLHHATIAPYGPYTSLDGRTLLIAVQNERQWQCLCEAVLLEPSLRSDPRFGTNEHRVANRKALDTVLNGRFEAQPAETWTRRLDEADVPWASINSVADVIAHPQLQHLWSTTETTTGPAVVVRPPFATAGPVGRVPALGEARGDVARWSASTDGVK